MPALRAAKSLQAKDALHGNQSAALDLREDLERMVSDNPDYLRKVANQLEKDNQRYVLRAGLPNSNITRDGQGNVVSIQFTPSAADLLAKRDDRFYPIPLDWKRDTAGDAQDAADLIAMENPYLPKPTAIKEAREKALQYIDQQTRCFSNAVYIRRHDGGTTVIMQPRDCSKDSSDSKIVAQLEKSILKGDIAGRR